MSQQKQSEPIEVVEAEVAGASEEMEAPKRPSFRKDLAVLTKLRLNLFVLITTLFGFVLATRSLGIEWSGQHFGLLFHTLLGTACAAFGSAAFNQLMEVDEDRQMERTADRPLPSRRMSTQLGFAIGWGLSAFGIIHLAAMSNAQAAYSAAITIGIYVFIYTPMKRWSSLNTLVGAIPGAIPPMIGWAGAGGDIFAMGSWILFALLFFWQLPHFVAINWLCREEYEKAGYKMWANGDVSGRRTAWIAFGFSLILAAVGLWPALTGYAPYWSAIIVCLAGLVTGWLAMQFRITGERSSARRLFFSTLIYLPVVLGLLALSWKQI